MGRLLAREALKDEIIRDIGPIADPAQWTKQRSGDIRPQYTEVAKLAKNLRVKGEASTAAQEEDDGGLA